MRQLSGSLSKPIQLKCITGKGLCFGLNFLMTWLRGGGGGVAEAPLALPWLRHWSTVLQCWKYSAHSCPINNNVCFANLRSTLTEFVHV